MGEARQESGLQEQLWKDSLSSPRIKGHRGIICEQQSGLVSSAANFPLDTGAKSKKTHFVPYMFETTKQIWLYPLKVMLIVWANSMRHPSCEGFKQVSSKTCEWMEPQVMCGNKSDKMFITPTDTPHHHPAQDHREEEERGLIINWV